MAAEDEQQMLPTGFQELSVAFERHNIDQNVIGVVTDYQPPNKSKGSDWQVTFSIRNDNYNDFGSGYRVKMFVPEDKVPKLQGLGDVIVLRNIKRKNYRGSPLFMSNFKTQCIVFPSPKMPERLPADYKLQYQQCPRASEAGFRPDEALMRYAWKLWEWGKMFVPAPQIAAKAVDDQKYLGKQGFQLLEKVGATGYYDLLGQVVKLYDQDGNGIVQLYLTDYSSNPLFWNYKPIGDAEGADGDAFGYLPARESNWRGPPGQFTLLIDIWGSNALWCRQNLKEKDYVRLSNVHVTFGKNSGSKLEGKMHEDRADPTKVTIHKVKRGDVASDEDMKELLVRKQHFIQHFGDWEKGDDRGKKRKAANEHHMNQEAIPRTHGTLRDVNIEEDQSLSKGQKKKKRRRQQAEGATTMDNTGHNRLKGLSTSGRTQHYDSNDRAGQVEIPRSRAQIRNEYDQLNPNIATSHGDRPLWKISDVLDHSNRRQLKTPTGTFCTTEFQTLMYLTEGRVVDFFPADLRDFAVRRKISEFDVLQDGDNSDNLSAESFDEIYGSASAEDSSDGECPTNLSADVAEDNDEDWPSKSYIWEWQFSIILEQSDTSPGGKPSRIIVHAAQDGASYLLKGLDACNLHKQKNRRALASLKEKLFILWGNLQEKKAEATPVTQATETEIKEADLLAGNKSQNDHVHEKRPWKSGLTNRPFRCCIREYGVLPAREEEKSMVGSGYYAFRDSRFQLFDTTIKT